MFYLTHIIHGGYGLSKYFDIKDWPEEKFRRLTGVKRTTFDEMIKILSKAAIEKKAKGGKPNTLILEDILLMSLEYIREYRTYLHLGQSYGLSESACYRNCRWVEDTLIKSGKFNLPGKKDLITNNDKQYEIVLLDATETPIERPKKSVLKISKG